MLCLYVRPETIRTALVQVLAYLVARQGCEVIAMSGYACLFVSISQKPLVKISSNFLRMLLVAMVQSLSDNNATFLCTSGFVDDIMFSRNGQTRMTQIKKWLTIGGNNGSKV